ncbi:MAG: hypothetical protein J7578_22565 [Chitinophagaceae bacterium]|nr:hypothetical protein [Chitinophagaceae bacterium]
MKKYLSTITVFFFSIFCVHAQHPVKFELLKVATDIVLPPATASAAYDKSYVNGKIDPSPLFGISANRFNQIFSGLAAKTSKQQRSADKSEKLLKKAHADGVGNMSTDEMEDYLKANPGLRKQTGVDASAMELATKMQDPAFRKKLESMNDMEKAAFLSPYASKSAAAASDRSNPSNAHVLVKAGKLVNKFNQEYQPKGMAFVEQEINDMNEKTDSLREVKMAVLQKEWEALPPIGANSPEWATQARALIEEKRMKLENETWALKLKGYRDIVSTSITRFKLAATPFDQFMAECDYGDKYEGASQTELLAQLAGYQEGMFRILLQLQDLCKDVTMRAAAFQEMVEQRKGK